MLSHSQCEELQLWSKSEANNFPEVVMKVATRARFEFTALLLLGKNPATVLHCAPPKQL